MTTLVGVTIVTVLLVAALPLVMHADRQRRVARTVRLATSDNSPGNRSFGDRIGSFPGRLSQLVYPIARNDATNHPDSCGVQYNNPNVSSWNSWGPFLGFQVDPDIGLPTPIGTANNNLVRDPPLGGAGDLIVVFPSVDEPDAILLDQMSDGATGSAAGVIRWSAPVSGTTTMEYRIAITAAC
jgi:hypothetical protein